MAYEIKKSIDNFPHALSQRPDYDLQDGDIVYVSGSSPAQLSVYLHLWRREGGRSDLTSELTIIDTHGELYRVEIEGIHVL